MKTVALNAQLVAVAFGVASLVSSAQAAATVVTPSSLTQCQPYAIQWSGATPPVYLTVIPGGQPSAAPLKQFPAQQSADGSFTWNVDLPAGTLVGLALNDGNGVPAYSNQVTIIDSKDSSCLKGATINSGVSGAGAGAGAGAGGGAGASGGSGSGASSAPPATGSGAAGTNSGGQAGAGPGSSPMTSTVGPPPATSSNAANATVKGSSNSSSTLSSSSGNSTHKNGTNTKPSGAIGGSAPELRTAVVLGAATTALLAVGGFSLLL